jgi:hypothetical protein
MPYIQQSDRDKFNLQSVEGQPVIPLEKIETCGELNYIITLICHNYIKRKGLRYQNINDVMGALEGAKTEFYRRVAAPYEDQKIIENGDVLKIIH